MASHAQDSADAQHLSVIICTHNRHNLLLATLASLRRQTLPREHFEVIVVDCLSTDGTVEAIRSYISASSQHSSWRVQCISHKDGNRSRARMRGLQVATGSIIVFLGDDTLLEPHFLERLSIAYKKTHADAIGGRTTLRCEHPRPSWLTDDMLALLGYFAPGETPMPLPATLSFSSCCFSVTRAALRAIGDFTLFAACNNIYIAPNVEIAYLCRALRQRGYTLCYEPAAVAVHCISIARLWYRFFTEQAYWRGRAEVTLNYIESTQLKPEQTLTSRCKDTVNDLLHDVSGLARATFVHLPMHCFTGRSMSEHIRAIMTIAHKWGRLQQRLLLLQHEPGNAAPVILLIRTPERDSKLLAQSLGWQQVCFSESAGAIPIAWLWRHRAYQDHPLAIIHIHRPGALELTPWARQRLLLLLRLAQHLGIRIVTSDAGGWWQVLHSLSILNQRSFERCVLHSSDIVLSYSLHTEQLYVDKLLRRHVRSLPQPGFRRYYAQPVERQEAYTRLGIPSHTQFVLLCFSYMHSEREIVQLVEAFFEATAILQGRPYSSSPLAVLRLQLPERRSPGSSTAVLQCEDALQLLLIGAPGDKKLPTQLLQKAAGNTAIHFFMEAHEEDMPLYLGATHAIVMPHFPSPVAGVLETAMLALSYERVVIAPDLPRFRGLLPADASILYDPFSRASLAQALINAPSRNYHLTEEGMKALDVEESWQQHTERLLAIYRQLLRC